jgi:hypothetical protein
MDNNNSHNHNHNNNNNRYDVRHRPPRQHRQDILAAVKTFVSGDTSELKKTLNLFLQQQEHEKKIIFCV